MDALAIERVPRRLGGATNSRRSGSARSVLKRALVVGLDSAAARLCRDVLGTLGFSVQAVETGVAAVVAAREHIPDVILMDAELRDVTAREAVAWLRSNSTLRDAPVIVVADDSPSFSAMSPAHVSMLLKKPLSRGALERAI